MMDTQETSLKIEVSQLDYDVWVLKIICYINLVVLTFFKTKRL